jgi:hypothetical protein
MAYDLQECRDFLIMLLSQARGIALIIITAVRRNSARQMSGAPH